MNDTEIRDLLYDLETIATAAGPGPARDMALRCSVMLERLAAANARLREQRDRSASVALGFALFAEPAELGLMIEDEDPAEAAQVAALVFPSEGGGG